VESNFNPKAINRNKNGTYDIGLMQINSSWFPYLKKHGINPSLLWDPCYNAHVGAMVLRHCIDTYGYSWRAVDCYNKGKKARENSRYVWKVYKNLQQAQAYANSVQNSDQ
jgi:soluble lytic murein transglycosylase-like protein